MKDKLEKTGRNKGYYRKHLALKLSLITLSFVTICAIPIGVSYRIAEVAHAGKEETSSQVDKSEANEEETNSQEESLSSI